MLGWLWHPNSQKKDITYLDVLIKFRPKDAASALCNMMRRKRGGYTMKGKSGSLIVDKEESVIEGSCGSRFGHALKGWNGNRLDVVEVRADADVKSRIYLLDMKLVLGPQLRIVFRVILSATVGWELEVSDIGNTKLLKPDSTLIFEDGVVNLVTTQHLRLTLEESNGELHPLFSILIRHHSHKGEYHKNSKTFSKNLKLEILEDGKRQAEWVELLQYHSINGGDELTRWRSYVARMLRRPYAQEKEKMRALKIVTSGRGDTHDELLGIKRKLRIAFEVTGQTIKLPPQLDFELQLIVQPEDRKRIKMKKVSNLGKNEVGIWWQGLTETQATGEDFKKIKHFLDFHLEGKVKVWDAGIDKPQELLFYGIWVACPELLSYDRRAVWSFSFIAGFVSGGTKSGSSILLSVVRLFHFVVSYIYQVVSKR